MNLIFELWLKNYFAYFLRMWVFSAKGFKLILIAGFLALTTADNWAADSTAPKPEIAPPATWVKPHFFDSRSALYHASPGADQHWLLRELQINVATNETFVHCARQILTVAGVQNGSNLKIDFNPSYQTLTLHWCRLWRGTNHLEQLAADKIQVVRQERDLEQDVLDGTQTAMLVMDDVRVGDIVDYAYSIRGDNPVFNSRFSTSFRAQMQEPVEQLMTRIVWPVQRRLYPKEYGCSIPPVIIKTNGFIECAWNSQQVPGLRLEDSLPVWYDPEAWVQLTEFQNWAEVNQWALALFQNHVPFSPELAQNLAKWKQIAGREQQVLAVLRFVQDQIRYFGIEIGASAEKPTDPSTVFSRRYGDCKDKSLLFVTLLRALGIEAYPVLVNTQARQTIADWLPAADIFDHCIAVVRLNDQNWWLDPTAGYQRGSLAMHYLPNYGYGLVISPKTTGLTRIPQTTGLPLTTTTEYFDLSKKAGRTDLKVVTVAEGRDADTLRAMFATTKHDDIEKSYTHFYAESYPGTQMSSPIEIQDNEPANRFQTTEHYTIDKAWIQSEKDGKFRCDFYPVSLAAYIKKPVDMRRKLPLAVDYPQHQILRTEITMPKSWTYPYRQENKKIIDPAFIFQKLAQRVGKKLVLAYEYQSLSDSVPADQVMGYFQNQDQMAKSLGDSFVWK